MEDTFACDPPLQASLPHELQEHITLLATDVWFDRLVPRRAGSSMNPFFEANERTHQVPQIERRHSEITSLVPAELRAVYERYPGDIEFTAPGNWTFMSEQEILTRRDAMLTAGQPRLVDFAFTYKGMGHVLVVSYDPVSSQVLTGIDGGANAFDRQHNYETRIRRCVASAPKMPFARWWDECMHTETAF
jgi:hypothetical protein